MIGLRFGRGRCLPRERYLFVHQHQERKCFIPRESGGRRLIRRYLLRGALVATAWEVDMT